MKLKWVGVFAFTCLSAFISGCGGSEDASMIACKKLDLKCTKSYRDNTLNFELGQKINGYVDQRESEIERKVVEINHKLSKYSVRSFPVDVINYADINKTRFNGLLFEDKLDGAKVYSGSATLFGNEIKVREGIGKASSYQSINDICKKIDLIKCKIAYVGKIDGVWTKKDESSSVLSGWIELENVTALPITLKETKAAISNSVHQEVGRKIWESKGDVSWGQIEDMVEKRVAEIN
jgi:hypothetical protein